MSTYGTKAVPGRPPRRPGLGNLRLLLLSVAIGFGVSFGGSLLLAGQITASSASATSGAEHVQVGGSDWAALAPAPPARIMIGGGTQPALNQRPIRRDELPTDEQIHRIYMCTVHAQPGPASELPEHLWACVAASDDG